MKSLHFFTFDRTMETASQMLHRLNDYTRTVNLDMLSHLKKQEVLNTRINELMSHTIHAHRIWLDRIGKREISVGVFDISAYETLQRDVAVNHSETAVMIDSGRLEETVNYTNTKGLRFSNTLYDIFMHVFNHSTYHRGQINQLLVQEGKKPMVTDYIVYHRAAWED